MYVPRVPVKAPHANGGHNEGGKDRGAEQPEQYVPAGREDDESSDVSVTGQHEPR